MKIYISGPISGRAELNEARFRQAAHHLTERGHVSVVPHDIDPWRHEGPCPRGYPAAQGGHTSACYLRGDLKVMLGCDALYMLEEWEASVGARVEHSVAAHCGLKICYAPYVSFQED